MTNPPSTTAGMARAEKRLQRNTPDTPRSVNHVHWRNVNRRNLLSRTMWRISSATAAKTKRRKEAANGGASVVTTRAATNWPPQRKDTKISLRASVFLTAHPTRIDGLWPPPCIPTPKPHRQPVLRAGCPHVRLPHFLPAVDHVFPALLRC
jgi:hypothetical protein